MNIIKPNMKYTETLILFKATLHKRRTQLCQRFFQGIRNPRHKLHYLLGDWTQKAQKRFLDKNKKN